MHLVRLALGLMHLVRSRGLSAIATDRLSFEVELRKAMTKNLDIRCELGEFYMASRCRMTIEIKYKPHKDKYSFCGSEVPELYQHYKDDKPFFAAVRNVLDEYRLGVEGSNMFCARPTENMLVILPWVLEMRYREQGSLPYRHSIMHWADKVFTMMCKKKELSLARQRTKKDSTPIWIYFIELPRANKQMAKADFKKAMGRSAGRAWHQFVMC